MQVCRFERKIRRKWHLDVLDGKMPFATADRERSRMSAVRHTVFNVAYSGVLAVYQRICTSSTLNASDAYTLNVLRQDNDFCGIDTGVLKVS